ncbi:hypothetical protein EDD34_2099 [Myceligenerans xiligouense]|uniref:MinD-like ATPase involved in chromosome partitioning or flagellar assembly n=1 Tax=Myceligenerans xiligouense TaxID=253184 RepID=A0A3N4YSD7_9MICO|nr:hypothetical protein EDD34_2099 [Myceligenerans xiligouense]
MAVVALCSASGAPGVSTTCLGLALVWPRPVLLVEADPRGTQALMTGWFQGARPYDAGLVELALSTLATMDALRDVARRIDGTDVRFVAGLRSHAQAPVLRGVWEPLAEALAELDATGTDVLVDAGALGYPGSPAPLLASADLTLLAVRSDLPALGGARAWAKEVGEDSLWRQAGVAVVGPGLPYTTREVSEALGLPVVTHVAWDPDGASVYHQGATSPRRFEASAYLRSLRAAASTITAAVGRLRLANGGDSSRPDLEAIA